METIAIIKQLEEHIEAIPCGTMGSLLKGCKRLIEAQGEDLREKADLIKMLENSEALKITQCKKLQSDLDHLRIVKANREENLRKSNKRRGLVDEH